MTCDWPTFMVFARLLAGLRTVLLAAVPEVFLFDTVLPAAVFRVLVAPAFVVFIAVAPLFLPLDFAVVVVVAVVIVIVLW